MKTYIATKSLVDDLTGNVITLDDYMKIETESLEQFMENLGFYFLGKYDDDLVYTKQNFNLNEYERMLIREVKDGEEDN